MPFAITYLLDAIHPKPSTLMMALTLDSLLNALHLSHSSLIVALSSAYLFHTIQVSPLSPKMTLVSEYTCPIQFNPSTLMMALASSSFSWALLVQSLVRSQALLELSVSTIQTS